MEQQETKKSKATRINKLFKKHKRLLKDKEAIGEFKEPIIQLIKRGNKVEWYEDATKGQFEYENSDGETRHITLNPHYQLTFDYGGKIFRGYICHEDYPIPLPAEPLVQAEMFHIAIDKTLNDMRKWKAEEISAKAGFWFKVLGGVALIILAYAIYKLLVKEPITTTDVQNLSNLTQVALT